ncbi:MAG TPA: hypothetical protein VF041_02315 [Gemmatimonadaceae bacterium]
MSADYFDDLTKSTAKAVTRRQTLRGLAAVFGGALLTSIAGKTAFAAPRTCVICQCGTGRPCNVKLTQCQETRGFSSEVTCRDFCQRNGQNLCGTGSPFHCPQGCS